jgi:tRNA A-37 threonylcarbamoyl transferase component Bud32/ligand-binding sensor domain-containing protein
VIRRLAASWFLLTASLLAGTSVQAFGQQYPFLPVPGGPDGANVLFQDSKGRLWVGGNELACFDGSRFFFLRDYGLPKTEVHAVAEDSGGAIWLAAQAGVFRFERGKIEEVSQGTADSVVIATPQIAVALLETDKPESLTRTSLVRIERRSGTWQSETVMGSETRGPLTVDKWGMVMWPWPYKGWQEVRLSDIVGWRRGNKLRVVDHRFEKYPGNGELKVMRDDDRCVWMGATGGNAYDCGMGVQQEAPYAFAAVRPNMHQARDGTMVLWGDNLLAIGRPGHFRIATAVNGLPFLFGAFPARDGTIWLATGGGLYRFTSPFSIEYWAPRDGVLTTPWSFASSHGRIFAGLSDRVAGLRPDRSQWETVASFPRAQAVTSLIDAGSNTLMAGFVRPGAAFFSLTGHVIASQTERIFMRMCATPTGAIWAGGSAAIGRVKRAGGELTFDEHKLETQPSTNVVSVKYERQTHKLWACYDGGLAVRNDDGSWQEWSTRNGLPFNACWSVAPLPNGDVWYANRGPRGIALLKNLSSGHITVRQYGPESGMTDPRTDSLDADQQGRLWRGGEAGVHMATWNQAEAGAWLTLNKSDGFPEDGINTGSFFADQDGSLWWGENNDVVHYIPPRDLVNPQFAPEIFLSAFSWGGKAPRLAEAVDTLPHGSQITAYIGSLQFDRRNNLRLRYRLLPDRRSWRETSNLDLALGKLGRGSHTLEVQARVFTGPWSETVSRSFTVLPPVGLQWPFLLGYAALGISLPFGWYVLQRRQQAEQAVLLPDLATWRMGALIPEARQLTGTVLDSRFEVGDLLARGGFANVMSGFDRVQQQRCAIKVFRNEVNDKSWVQRRFEQELTALQQVRHPNVVAIYAHGATPTGSPYLVMEFVEGKCLREVLAHGALAPERVAKLLLQLAAALEAIHRQNIWHRDVKPENVMLRHEGTSDEQPVLIDFSIAIVKDADATLHGLSRAAGTFDYMAPEQAIGYAQPSSDIYSLVKLTLEMLTGRRLSQLLPDAALDLPERVRDLARGLNLGLSEESIEMLATALEFDPTKRPQAVGAFARPLVRDISSGGQGWEH